jgi:hypothetical protein
MPDLDDAIRRAWPVLREAIAQRRTLTYTELAGRAGPPLHRRHLHRQLLIGLAHRCRVAGLPDLAALVVRQDSGMPGAGWHGLSPAADPAGAWAAALETCWSYPWPRALPATLASRPDFDEQTPRN